MSKIVSETKKKKEPCMHSAIVEVSALTHEIADMATTSQRAKDRITAVSRAVGFKISRISDFYYSNPKASPNLREGDTLRQKKAELKAKRLAYEQAIQFNQTAAYLRQVDADFHQHTIAALELAAVSAGAVDFSLDEE